MLDPQKHKTVRIINDPGNAHFLTYSCFNQQPFLKGRTSCEWFCESLTAAAIQHDIALWAFVIMPEHVHLLVKPRKLEYNISKFHTSVKQSVVMKAYAYRVRSDRPDSVWERFYDVSPRGDRTFRFWQRGPGYDKNVTSPAGVPEILDYIHYNPVRRELCSAPAEWPWSSAGYFEGCGECPVPLDPIDF